MASPSDPISIQVKRHSQCALQTPRWWAGEVPVGDGKVMIAGGTVPDATAAKHEKGTTAIEVLDVVRCKSQKLKDVLQSDHRGSQPQVLRNGQAVFFGGMATDLIETVNGTTVRPGGKLVLQRSAAASVELSDGRVLITGGYHNADGKAVPQKSAEIYDPRTGASAAITDMSIARASHSVTPIGGGRYLIAGGAKEAAQSAEIYDEKTGEFVLLDSRLHFGRKDHRAVVDSSKRIWLIGGTGVDGQSQDAVEYFDGGQFISTEMKLKEGREDLAAIYIPELNLIAVVGGEKKGVFGERKDPPSAAIDVLNLNTMTVSSTLLSSERDEPTLHIIRTDPKARTASILVLQGLAEGSNGQKRVPPPEKIIIRN